MINAINALLECFVTGLVVSLFILLFARIGWLPLMLFVEQTEEEE